jgi:hypothetical protein
LRENPGKGSQLRCHAPYRPRRPLQSRAIEIPDRTHGAEGRRGWQAAPNDDFTLGKVCATHSDAGSRRNAASIGHHGLNRIARRGVQAVQPCGRSVGERRLGWKPAMYSREDQLGRITKAGPGVLLDADSPPARSLQLPPRKAGTPCFHQVERTFFELLRNDRAWTPEFQQCRAVLPQATDAVKSSEPNPDPGPTPADASDSQAPLPPPLPWTCTPGAALRLASAFPETSESYGAAPRFLAIQSAINDREAKASSVTPWLPVS